MMGRMPWLEGAFGLDKLSYIHRRHGKLVFYFLLLHPTLLLVGNSISYQLSLSATLAVLLALEYVVYAVIGLILFITVIISSIRISRSKLRYEYWYFVHLMVYVAIFFAFRHQFELGEDLEASSVFYAYWAALYIIIFSSHIFFRWIRPLARYFKHRFYVERVHRETHEATSIYISGKNMEQFHIQPGQFMLFRFLRHGWWWQQHPFSLSMAPNGKEIRITPKVLGDFTKEIQHITPGTKVYIDGPYGVFTDYPESAEKMLLIAGGIGITPVRALIERFMKRGKDVVLLYGNKKTEDIVFKHELEEFRKKGLRVTYIISDEPSFTGEKGYIDAEKIGRLVSDFKEREVFLCGPPAMMDSVLVSLEKLGISKNSIFFERFELG